MMQPRNAQQNHAPPARSIERRTGGTGAGERIPMGHHVLVCVLIVAAAGMAYHNSFKGAFVFDDAKQILENDRLYQVFPLRQTLGGRRPVVDLTLAVNLQAGLDGRNVEPAGFHAVNLAVHVLAGLLLLGVVRRTLLGRHCIDRVGPAGRWIALVVTLLWIVHPLQTQSVSYIIQRAEAMGGLFYLAVLYCVIRGAESRRGWAWYTLAILASALGMGCKATLVSAPLVVFLYDRFFLCDSWLDVLRRRWAVYGGLAASWGVLGICGVLQGVLSSDRPDATVGFSYHGTTPAQYALTQAGVLLHYLQVALWPHPLCLDHLWPIVTGVGDWLPAAAAVALMIGATAWGFERWRGAGFLAVWFFLILAPTSSVVPIKDALFEHRMYLPLAATIVAAVMAVHALLRMVAARFPTGDRIRPLVAGMLALVAVGLCAYATNRRNVVYRSDLAVWKDIVQKRPAHARAWLGVGAALYRTDDLDGAEGAFKKVIALEPQHAGAYHNFGNVLEKRGDLRAAEAAFRRSVQLDSRSAKVQYSLGRVLLNSGRAQEAVVALTEAVQLDAAHVPARVLLGNALRQVGRHGEALEHYGYAVYLRPNDVDIRVNVAAVLKILGRREEAIAEMESALAIDPDHQLARDYLARLRGEQ